MEKDDTIGVVAIDLALIPDRTDWLRLNLFNERLTSKNYGFSFDEGHLPHITLWQDYVEEKKLPDLVGCLEKASFEIPFRVEMSGLNTSGKLDEIHFTPCLEMEGNLEIKEKIQSLHTQVLHLTKNFSSNGLRERGRFFGNNQIIHPQCFKYVQKYVQEKSNEFFYPHLTLGCGEKLDQIERLSKSFIWPMELKIGEIVLGVMGNVCTIGEILWSKKVKK